MKKDDYDYVTDYCHRRYSRTCCHDEYLGYGFLALIAVAIIIYQPGWVLLAIGWVALIAGMILISNYCKKRVSQKTWIILNIAAVVTTIIGGILALIFIPPLF